MDGLEQLAGSHQQWSLGSFFGYEHPLLIINIPTVVYTWVMLALLCAALLPIRAILHNHKSVLRIMIIEFVGSFIDLCNQAMGGFTLNHLSLIVSLFVFILMANTLSIIPWMEEPTTDLNTALALGIITFLYTQAVSIKSHGVVAYIKEYFSPFFIMAPLHVVGKLASIASISFRLFGNIFGGAIISHLYLSSIRGSLLLETIGIVSGINLVITLFFGLFEGFLQAFVFAMLALTYLAIALHGDGDGE